MKDIKVLAGDSFFNEDSTLLRYENITFTKKPSSIPGIEDTVVNQEFDSESKTTMREMYADGWSLNTAIKHGNIILFFFER